MTPRGPLTAVGMLAWQSVRRRPLSTILTALSVALGLALVVAVGRLRGAVEGSYDRAARGYDLILGPPGGSPLQTVLSTLFHVDVPYGTLDWDVYEKIQADPRVAVAVPYAIGDTYRGHRVVGTSARLFDTLDDVRGRPIGDGLVGRLFGEEGFEAVVGSQVARATGLKLGATFQVTHGLAEVGHRHGETWTVVGVLRPTNTPHDRAIYIPIASFYEIEGHGTGAAGAEDDHDGGHDGDGHDGEEAGSGDGHDDDGDGAHHGERTLSAIGLRLAGRNPQLLLGMLQEFRTKRSDAQAMLPSEQVRKLLEVVGDVNRGLSLIAWLVTVVAAIAILVGLYNTIQGRRREIAILRAVGARALHVFAVILLEALLLCALGAAAGLLLAHGALAVAAPTLLASYGVTLPVGPGADDAWALMLLLGIGVLAGLLPAWRGLRTPVAENLHPDA